MFKIYLFKSLNSTNEKAKDFEENSVIIAEEQIKGKGRFKRHWSSSKNGIYLSIVLPCIAKPQFYTFIACLSALKAINNKKIKIKWPNDLIHDKKKLCGILTEVKNNKAIIGIGINTNNKIPKSLEEKAISLKIINKKVNNKKIINKLLNHFENYLKLLERKKYSKIIKDWKENSFLGEKIKVKTMNKTYGGTAYNINKDLFLIVKDKEGRKIRIVEGDIILT